MIHLHIYIPTRSLKIETEIRRALESHLKGSPFSMTFILSPEIGLGTTAKGFGAVKKGKLATAVKVAYNRCLRECATFNETELDQLTTNK